MEFDFDFEEEFKQEMTPKIEKPKKKHTIYQIISSTINKDFYPTDDEINTVNPFFMLKNISNTKENIFIANKLNMTKNISNKANYLFIRNSNIKKIKYINISKSEKIDNEYINKIIKIHKVTSNVAIQLLDTYRAIDKLEYVDEEYKKFIKRERKV